MCDEESKMVERPFRMTLFVSVGRHERFDFLKVRFRSFEVVVERLDEGPGSDWSRLAQRLTVFPEETRGYGCFRAPVPARDLFGDEVNGGTRESAARSPLVDVAPPVRVDPIVVVCIV
jgi:hypothetical protein